jgi:hypothetical protein
MGISVVYSKFENNAFFRGLTLGLFGLTFWRYHYFSSLRLSTPTNFGMGISMVCSNFENSAFFRGLTRGLFGMTFWYDFLEMSLFFKFEDTYPH